jgi:hypothetical protein
MEKCSPEKKARTFFASISGKFHQVFNASLFLDMD